jgi:hypothetical protein
MADVITVPLQFPIQILGKTVSELTIQRPKAKHFWEMDKVEGEQRKFDALLASVCGASLVDIGELDGADRVAAQEALLPFLTSQAKPTASG